VNEDKSKEKLLSRQEILKATHLSSKALNVYEKAGYISGADVSDGVKYYSQETAELIKAMEQCQSGRSANLQEAYKIATQGSALKKRRSSEADASAQIKTIDPRKIKTHPRFKGLLSIDEDLAESLTADMVVGGYFTSQPIVLATWAGQEEPVLIDGHTRVRAAIEAGLQKIPYTVETFDNIDGALEYIAKVQTHRRPTDDWVRYQLIIELDSLMERGGDRRSEQAKSKGSQDPLEKKYPNSAERTAAFVGCSPTTVKGARRIMRDGWPSLLKALQNRKVTISQAEQEIAKRAKADQTTEAESQVEEKENAMVQVNEEYRDVLTQMEGTLHEHVNKAVRMYIRWLRDKGRLPKE
jgi:DNA-binding transcriptional MerR regulator